MKRTLYVLSIFIILVVACSKQKNEEQDGNYHWLEGVKIPFLVMDGEFLVIYYSADRDMLENECAIAGIELSEGRPRNVYPIDNTASPIYDYYVDKREHFEEIIKMETAYITGSYEQAADILSSSLIVYWSPFYSSDWLSEPAPVGDIIWVTLKSMKDLPLLEQLAMENFVEIVGAYKYIPTIYTLCCTKRSKGGILEMSDLFYESRLFERVVPGIHYAYAY